MKEVKNVVILNSGVIDILFEKNGLVNSVRLDINSPEFEALINQPKQPEGLNSGSEWRARRELELLANKFEKPIIANSRLEALKSKKEAPVKSTMTLREIGEYFSNIHDALARSPSDNYIAIKSLQKLMEQVNWHKASK